MKTKNYQTSNAKRYKNRPGRIITVGEIQWKYNVGHSGVVAYSELGDRLYEDAWKVKGLSNPNDFDRGKWKRSSDGMVLPSEVVKWIKSHESN